MVPIKCFYLDEPLSPEEEKDTLSALLKWETDADAPNLVIEYQRVPYVFNVTSSGYAMENQPVEKMVENLRKYLRNAGVWGCQRQPIWIMPKDAGLGAAFTLSFVEEVGGGPYVVQRWKSDSDSSLARCPVRVMDANLALGGYSGG